MIIFILPTHFYKEPNYLYLFYYGCTYISSPTDFRLKKKDLSTNTWVSDTRFRYYGGASLASRAQICKLSNNDMYVFYDFSGDFLYKIYDGNSWVDGSESLSSNLNFSASSALDYINTIGDEGGNDDLDFRQYDEWRVVTNKTWSGTLNIPQDSYIKNGATVNISAGANITMQNTAALFAYDGTLNVNGANNNEVTFNLDGYYGISVENSNTININHAIINGNGSGIGVTVGNGTININNTEINNFSDGVYVSNFGNVNVDNCEIYDCNKGVYVDEGIVNVDNCEIYDCYYGIYLYRTNYVSYPSSYITNTHSHDNEFGVVMYYSKAHLSYNEFNDNYIGLGCADYSSPYLATDDNNSESYGYNNIHHNTHGVYAYGYSNPFLGRETCISFGGNNTIANNTSKEIFIHTHSNIYAENNYWGVSTPSSSQFYIGSLNCSLDYIPYLSSAPQQGQSIVISPEEENFNSQFALQLSNANNSSGELLLSSSDIPVGYNKGWNIEWKLLYARNLMRVKKYNSASTICENVINNYPDSSLSYLALDLLHQSRVSSSSKSLFSQFVKEKANKKVKKQIYGAAELLLAGGKRKNRILILDGIAEKYKDTPIVEFVLFQKFLYYFNEEKNIKLAQATSDELEELFPKSESYLDSERHLGSNEKRTFAPQLAKNNSEETTFEMPKEYVLFGNYPNPFNPSTTISYALPYSSNVEITIYNVTGEVVKAFTNTAQSVGKHNVVWHGKNEQGSRVSSGVYFYKFSATSLEGNGKVFEKTAKFLLLK